MHLRQHESGRCGLLWVLPWLTLPGHWLHVLAAPDTRLSSTIVCAVKQFSHHFLPWRQSAHSLLTRVLTSFRFHLGILLSCQAPIHPLTDSPKRECAPPLQAWPWADTGSLLLQTGGEILVMQGFLTAYRPSGPQRRHLVRKDACFSVFNT